MTWICSKCETHNTRSDGACEVCGEMRKVTPPRPIVTKVETPIKSKRISSISREPVRTAAKPRVAPKLPPPSKSRLSSVPLRAWGSLAGVFILLWVLQIVRQPSPDKVTQTPSGPPAPIPSTQKSVTKAKKRVAQEAAQAQFQAQAETQAQQARSIKKAAIEEMLDVRKKAQSGLLTRAEIENQQTKLRRSLTSSLDCAEKALRLDPSNRTAWEQKTAVLYLLERFGEGLESAERGLKLYPKDVDLLEAKDKIQTKMRGGSQGSSSI